MLARTNALLKTHRDTLIEDAVGVTALIVTLVAGCICRCSFRLSACNRAAPLPVPTGKGPELCLFLGDLPQHLSIGPN